MLTISRRVAAALAVIVLLADVGAIIGLTGYAQMLADTAGSPAAPWWLGPAWVIAFFPARYALLLPAFNHPRGLGGPDDDLIWFGLAVLNGLLWASATYLLLRRRTARTVAA